MLFLASFNWGWLVGAGLIGLIVGWIAVVQHGDGLSLRAMRLLLAVLAVVAAAAFARLLPGRFGYWLDLGLVMGTCYVVGCAIGSWLRERVVSRETPASLGS